MGKKRNQPGKSREPDCEACGSRCCRYLATQIDTPSAKRDYDHIRWYLLHRHVNVFIDHEDDWYIEFQTPCVALTASGRCAGYENRPRLCRAYGDEDTICEYHSEEAPHQILFSSAEEFENYLDREGIEWRWKRH